MTRWRKTFLGLAALLSVCLVVAGWTTFQKHHGGDQLKIAEAAPLPTADRATSKATPGELSASPMVVGTPKKKEKKTHKPHPTRTAKSTPVPSKPSRRVTSVKKGAALWKTPGIDAALTDSGVSWFYNWSNKRDGVSAKGVEFVPMMWGADSVNASSLSTAKANGKVLLGFNEPDLGEQSNMSVERALDLWPQLEKTGMRLGSPAVAYAGADANGWLDRFMTGASQKGYRVDFITLHWYGGDFDPDRATDQLRSYVSAVWNRYHKPIWITEYSLMNWGGGPRIPSASVQASFVKKSTAMLQGLSYVQRYAWFAFPTSTDGTDGTGLYRNGVVTQPGKAYRAAG